MAIAPLDKCATMACMSITVDATSRRRITAGTLDTPTGLRTNLALFGAEASDYHRLDPEVETEPYDRSLGVSDD